MGRWYGTDFPLLDNDGSIGRGIQSRMGNGVGSGYVRTFVSGFG